MNEKKNRLDEIIAALEMKILAGNNGLSHDYCELLAAQREEADNEWTLRHEGRIQKMEDAIDGILTMGEE